MAMRLFFPFFSGGGDKNTTTMTKDFQMTSKDMWWLMRSSSKNMGMLHIKWKLIIGISNWKWENGIWRSSEVIRGQKQNKKLLTAKYFTVHFLCRVLVLLALKIKTEAGLYILTISPQIENQGRIRRRTSWKKNGESTLHKIVRRNRQSSPFPFRCYIRDVGTQRWKNK